MKGFTPPPRFSQQVSNEPLPITRSITITEGISVKDLAEKLEVRAKEIIARLLQRGVFATVNQTLDAELARDMARQFGADVVEELAHQLSHTSAKDHHVRLQEIDNIAEPHREEIGGFFQHLSRLRVVLTKSLRHHFRTEPIQIACG